MVVAPRSQLLAPGTRPTRGAVHIDCALRLEVLNQGIDFIFEAVLRRLLLEGILVDGNVAEQQETV